LELLKTFLLMPTGLRSLSLFTLVELFTGEFIDHLFELVERTRLLYDEALNYALIKLLVRLASSSFCLSC
jgi:hypothetical protein